MLGKFVNTLRASLPFLKDSNKPRGQQVLALRPIRNPGVKWHRDEATGLVVVSLAYHPYRTWDKVIGKLFQIPTERRLEMSDELSSMVWELCDGQHTVTAIASQIARDYKLTQRQSEVSVLAFLNTLQGKRLVGVLPNQAGQQDDSATPKPPTGPRGSKKVYGSRKQRSTHVARERGH